MKNPKEVTGFFKKLFPKIGLFFDVEKIKKIVDLVYILIEKLSINFPIIAKDYIFFYEELVDKEIKLANITKKDKILNIGCGPVPATSLLISKKTGAKITCIDINEGVIKQAKEFLKNQGIKDIKLEHGDGTQYSANEFDIIFISWGVDPLTSILKNVIKTMKNDARIVIRAPESSNFYYLLEKELDEKIKVEKIVTHPSYSNSKSILLVKSSNS
jgi:precorrin-6B methylase 2